ncbi:DUF445 domain-containing protein [Nocardioides euryhalodurans]|uniref:DUF445 domain-containing protein n=1 Tax=Nocardioides euryhalodurans TaxID=2518370 RepID=A0A4P7GJ66_9ACTN|nr:DUF445 domain-containing protein [Nocardioides euryhalodurans]QBR91777.1 DUF445 domain-containing protein [Nocardioides euryhalodurans]
MSATVTMTTPNPAADDVRRRGLRRMRTLAVGLLLFAAVVYALTLGQDGFLGFVNAGAEASMVGAIADWFAVTALFKHPLGIPIPHTALVPKRKDALGQGLQEFFGENFLQESIIRDRVAAATISRRLGEWLSDPGNARRVVDEVSEVAGVALSKVRDEHISDLVESVLVPRFREEPIAPLLGTFVVEAVRDDLHHGVVDLALEELHRWLVHNPDTFTEVLSERAPWWAPPRLNDAVTTRIHTEAVRWIADIRDDPRHHAREALDSMLGQLGQDLLFDPDTQARAEAMKNRLLDHPQFAATGISLWNALRKALVGALRDPSGELRTRAEAELVGFAERLVAEEELRRRFDGLAADAAVFFVERYGAELTTVITHTIERWDGREAADRIELHVGRDLQFIRINGTIVGGLVGVLIHAVTVVV